MSKDPAFLFYSKDWIEGTAELMPAEKGVYIDLLCHQHQRGDLPSDPRRLARIVGLSTEEFEPIWQVLGEKFVANGNRLVNRKLTSVMTERSAKAHRNRIIGIFAALIRTAKISDAQRASIKKLFNIEQFVEIPTEILTERITEWFTERLASLGNGNANVNVNVNEDVGGGAGGTISAGRAGGDQQAMSLEETIQLAFGDIYLEQQRMVWRDRNVDFEYRAFVEKVRGSPGRYEGRDTDGLRLAFQKQLRESKPFKPNDANSRSHQKPRAGERDPTATTFGSL